MSLNRAYNARQVVKYGRKSVKKTKIIFPSENGIRSIYFAVLCDFHHTIPILNAKLVINLLLISFHVTSLSIEINTGVFPGIMSSDRRKNHRFGPKKPEGTSSAIFGVGNAAKCCELKRCADRVRWRR